MRGKFITFEGTEGAGKSTQVKLLVQALRRDGCAVREVREPGGTLLGEKVRHLVKHEAELKGMSERAELLLLSASRAQLVAEVIEPALAKGELVVSDRFYDSTMAYQGFGRELGYEVAMSAINLATAGLEPDVTFMLRVPPDVALARTQARANQLPGFDRFESELEFFTRVEHGYSVVSWLNPKRVVVVRADRPVEDVFAEILSILRSREIIIS